MTAGDKRTLLFGVGDAGVIARDDRLHWRDDDEPDELTTGVGTGPYGGAI